MKKTIEEWCARLLAACFLVCLLIVLGACLTACKSRPSLKTLAATQDVIYGTKKAWTAYLKAEYMRVNKMPAEDQIPLRDKLRARNEKALAISAKVDAAWWRAWDAAKAKSDAPSPSELLALVAEFKLATQ